MGSEPSSPSSLKQKLKSSLCIAGCFRQNNHDNSHIRARDPTSPRDRTSQHASSQSPSHRDHGTKVKSPRLSRTWTKSHDKCRHLINRIGGGGGGSRRHIRRHTADFHYDALSYALNFDEGCEDDEPDQVQLRNFSARLPASPPATAKAARSTSPGRQFFAVDHV